MPISPKYSIHADRIHHTVYLASLCNKKQIVTKDRVIEYVEKMEPGDLLFYINYDNRKYI